MDWEPVMQRSLAALDEGNLVEGAEACRLLLNAVGLPDTIRDVTYRNQTFYAQTLCALIPDAVWEPLLLPLLVDRVLRDPSPIVTGDHLMVLVHAVSGLPNAPLVEPPAARRNFDGIAIMALLDEAHEGRQLTAARPFVHRGVLRASVLASKGDEHGQTLAGAMTLAGGVVSQLRLFGPRYGNFRHGWAPLVVDDQAHFIAWWEPTEVFALDEDSGEFKRVALRMAPRIAERFQSGSQGVPVPDGYLFLVNESAIMATTTEHTAKAGHQGIARILEATYGRGADRVDVTARLQDCVRNGQLLLTVSNNLFGDPCPDRIKTLRFTYELFDDSQQHQHAVWEHQIVSLPAPGDEGMLARFMRVDEEFQITDISPQFFVKDRGKDVASGLARQGDRLIAGFTSADHELLLATMPIDAVMATLIQVDAPGRPAAARRVHR
jgi:hypothetical protein